MTAVALRLRGRAIRRRPLPPPAELSQNKTNRSFVPDVRPSSGVALSRSSPHERSAPVAVNLGLLPNHCAVEMRAFTRDDLEEFHG
jgi:hypothetical protein